LPGTVLLALSTHITLFIKILLAINSESDIHEAFPKNIFVSIFIISILFTFAGNTFSGGLEDGYPDDTSVAGSSIFWFCKG
jgi:hypothetical protein